MNRDTTNRDITNRHGTSRDTTSRDTTSRDTTSRPRANREDATGTPGHTAADVGGSAASTATTPTVVVSESDRAPLLQEGRRLTGASVTRMLGGQFASAAQALPAIEYRVASLRVLTPTDRAQRALRETDARDAFDAADDDRSNASVHASGAPRTDADPSASPRETPGDARARLAGPRRKTPSTLLLDGEPVVTTPRFWWSLFTRCGLNDAVFRYFEPSEVFARVAQLDAGRSVRFAIEGGGAASGGRPRRLLAVSSPGGPLLDRDHAAEIVDMHGGHGVGYADGVLTSMHLPAQGDRVIAIGPDGFRNRFHLEVPVDGLGEPRIHVALLRLLCLNGAIGMRSAFRSAIRLGKDPEHSLERALGHYANDDGFSAMRQRFESAQRSWASLREVRLLEAELNRISWGITDGAAERRHAFRRMVGDYESRYGLASIDAISVKRQRMLQAGCRMYDLINFATEVASHHAPPVAASRLQGWLGGTITEEFDLENTANDVPEFVDVFTNVPYLHGARNN